MNDRKKRDKRLKAAIEPLYEFDEYGKSFDEEKAKLTLIRFFRELNNIKPDKYFIAEGRVVSVGYYSYFINLIPVMLAINSKQYASACHEIITLNHYERILQQRVYLGLMILYHKYLE